MMESRHYRVNRSDICFIKYLLESYEGLAMVSTLDAAEGHIVVRIAPGCSETVTAVMASLADDMYFETILNTRPTDGGIDPHAAPLPVPTHL